MNASKSEKPVLLAKLSPDVSLRTATNWATRGVRGVVLDSFFVGGRRYVLPSSYAEFLSKLNGGKAVDLRP